MTLFSRLMYAPDAATGLCAICSWGTVRKGFRPAEAETFCRLVGPGSRVLYPVRQCTDYCDRRVAVTAQDARRYGFVTELKLAEDGEVRTVPAEESERGNNK